MLIVIKENLKKGFFEMLFELKFKELVFYIFTYFFRLQKNIFLLLMFLYFDYI